MNGKRLVIDTNILLYFLNGDRNVRAVFFEYEPVISFISELELLSAPNLSEQAKRAINELLEDVTIVKYFDYHKEDIIKLRSKKKLKLPDAIIASLAITMDIPLFTADKALRDIPEADIIFYETPGI